VRQLWQELTWRRGSMRVEQVTPQVVELAPKELSPGVLYISFKYKLALHLCCCGCGEKVVTPLSPAEWDLRLVDGKATLHPSIGNWSMACKSHYVIRNNRIVWAGGMTDRQMAAVFSRDKASIDAMHRIAMDQSRNSDEEALKHSNSSSIGDLLKAFWNWLLGRNA